MESEEAKNEDISKNNISKVLHQLQLITDSKHSKSLCHIQELNINRNWLVGDNCFTWNLIGCRNYWQTLLQWADSTVIQQRFSRDSTDSTTH